MQRRLIAAFAAAALCAAACQPVPAFASMLLRIEIGANPHPKRPSGPVDTLRDFEMALRQCYAPPPIDEVSQPVDLTFQISFKRSGELFGKPRVVSFAREVSPEERARYYLAVAAALELCSPIPFTEAMGGAWAGHPVLVSFIDTRNRRQAMTNG